MPNIVTGLHAPIRSHTRAPSRPVLALVGGLLLVLGGAGSLLLPQAMRRNGADQPAVVEVELVDQTAATNGAPLLANTPVAPTPSAPVPAPADVAPSSARAALPAPPEPVQPAAPTTINLGTGPQDRDPLRVQGPQVVPPRLDALTHNKPPPYPADAARRGSQGTVRLVVHVTEGGLPAWVDVEQSSGDNSLDRAAQEAVALWRFTPARQGGAPVPFDYEQDIRFTIGNR